MSQKVSYAHIFKDVNGEYENTEYCPEPGPWIVELFYGELRHWDEDWVDARGAATHEEAIEIASNFINKNN